MWKLADSPLRGDRSCSRVIRVMLSPSPRSTNHSGIGIDQPIAGRDVGDDLPARPRLAERALPPAVGGHRVDRLEVPARRLREPAGLSFHLGYLSAGAGPRVRTARKFAWSSTPSLPLKGPP